MDTAITYVEVAEGVRAAIAAYTQALDDGRTDDVVAMFCPDGEIDMPGLGAHHGHEALREAYARWQPPGAHRHLVANTHVAHWTADEAQAVSDVVFLMHGDGGWAIQAVGRYHDVLHRDGGTWRFHRRVGEFVMS